MNQFRCLVWGNFYPNSTNTQWCIYLIPSGERVWVDYYVEVIYHNHLNMYTFLSIIKPSLLTLLCTLTHLCKVTPLQQIRLDFFGSSFPCILSLTISADLIFAGRTTAYVMGLEHHHPIMSMLWSHGGRSKRKKEEGLGNSCAVEGR